VADGSRSESIPDGTQVDPRYAGSPFLFRATLDRVVITLKD
jgi:hypothetical protein